MKKLIEILAISFIMFKIVQPEISAQGLMLRQYSERTNSGTTVGANVNYTLHNAMQIGVFYLHNVSGFVSESSANIYNELEYMGVFYSFPLTKHKKFNIAFQSRFGLSNGNKVTYAPALVGSMQLTPRLALEAGISNRLYSFGNIVGISYQLGKLIKRREIERSEVSRYF